MTVAQIERLEELRGPPVKRPLEVRLEMLMTASTDLRFRRRGRESGLPSVKGVRKPMDPATKKQAAKKTPAKTAVRKEAPPATRAELRSNFRLYFASLDYGMPIRAR